MIEGVDHVVIGVRDLAAGVAAYETLLGARAAFAEPGSGVAVATLATANAAVELMAPSGEAEIAQRLRAAMASGEGLVSLVFAVGDLERAYRRAERVGLAPQEIVEGSKGRSFRAGAANGLRIFFMQRAAALRRDAYVLGLDHIVVRTGEPERAAALLGARLGLDLRLDREIAGRRLMFFRCGDTVIEIAHERDAGADALWGLAWRVADADAANARLGAAGFTVSPVRQGVKPGTRVFSVRDGACGVPTLMIETALDRP